MGRLFEIIIISYVIYRMYCCINSYASYLDYVQWYFAAAADDDKTNTHKYYCYDNTTTNECYALLDPENPSPQQQQQSVTRLAPTTTALSTGRVILQHCDLYNLPSTAILVMSMFSILPSGYVIPIAVSVICNGLLSGLLRQIVSTLWRAVFTGVVGTA